MASSLDKLNSDTQKQEDLHHRREVLESSEFWTQMHEGKDKTSSKEVIVEESLFEESRINDSGIFDKSC